MLPHRNENRNRTYQMKTTVLTTSLFTCTLLPFAQTQAHDMEHFAFGQPAKASQVTRTIHVKATDNMRFEFDSQEIHAGDVVRFIVTNTGQLPHEFGIGDAVSQRKHAKEMEHMPNMQHDDPNVISLKPGETKSLIWKFKAAGKREIIFACNVPGHVAAGMLLTMTLKK
jgi:uncharacterized cupredoxin-like copper-binding protein